MGAVGVPGDEDEAERVAGVDEEAAMGDARFPARAELAVQATNEEAPSNHLRLEFDVPKYRTQHGVVIRMFEVF